MRPIGFVVCTAMLLATTSAQSPPRAADSLREIAGEILVSDRAYEDLAQLTSRFGHRLSGSENYNRAAQWALEQFKSYGVDSARLEYWTLPHSWKRGTATATVVAPELNGERAHAMHIVSSGWSSSTPRGGVEGDVLVLDSVKPEALRTKGEELRGKIVLVNGTKLPQQSELDTYDVEQLSAHLKEYGVLAILNASRMNNEVVGTGDPAWWAEILPVPEASLGREDAEALFRALKQGPVRLRVEIQNVVGGPVQVPNIVAEIKGSSRPEEWVLLGAHFDSWDLATGAQDNGAGTVQVMEAARAIAATKRRPARSMRFVLFGGEEEGLLGSFAYVAQHRAELKNCDAMLNTDNGAGLPNGWNVEGRKDVSETLNGMAKELAGFGGSGVRDEVDFDTDHGPFLLEGIPVLNMWVDMSKYGEVHHLAGDTIEKVNRHSLDDGAALLAVTGYQVADAEKPLAPHLDRAQVEELLKPREMGEYLKRSQLWK